MDKKRIFLLSLLFIPLFLAACQPDPRREADAYATRSQADQQAADAEQARLIQEQLHAEHIKELELKQQINEANKQTWINVKFFLIWTFGIFGCILLATVLLYSARSYAIASVGVARAAAQGAMVRANSIYLDPRTRQSPLLLQNVGGTKWALINPNVGSVLMLDVSHEPDRQLIATSGATQIAGVLASEAAKSHDPTGMAMIRPPIVHSQADGSILGADYLSPGKEER
jgi:hypothetical protein